MQKSFLVLLVIFVLLFLVSCASYHHDRVASFDQASGEERVIRAHRSHGGPGSRGAR